MENRSLEQSLVRNQENFDSLKTVTSVLDQRLTLERVLEPVYEQYHDLLGMKSPLTEWVMGERGGTLEEALTEFAKKCQLYAPNLRAQSLDLRKRFAES